MIVQFEYKDIHLLDNGGEWPFWFECSMVSTCKPVFNQCSDNYEVEQVLRRAGVIRKRNHTDTESCALVVLFKNPESAHQFIDRLNAFLRKKGGKP